jgi:hypothetical protein
VPARIIAARAPPQRDPSTDQPQISGVIVDGIEDLRILPADGRNSRHADHAFHSIQGGRPRWGSVVFPLDLTDDGGHALAP